MFIFNTCLILKISNNPIFSGHINQSIVLRIHFFMSLKKSLHLNFSDLLWQKWKSLGDQQYNVHFPAQNSTVFPMYNDSFLFSGI